MSSEEPVVLKYFQYEQFVPKSAMWQVGENFYNTACFLLKVLPPGIDRDSAMQRLLEAKDLSLRATMV